MSTWEKRMRRARKLHRPSLKDWEADNLYQVFPDFQRALLEDETPDALLAPPSLVSDDDDNSEVGSIQNRSTPALRRRHPRDYETFFPSNHESPTSAPAKLTMPQQQGQTKQQYLQYYLEQPQIPAILDGRTLTCRDFWDNYEAKEIPCLLRNIPFGYEGGQPAEPWTGLRHWPLDQLRHNRDLRNRLFKCGEDDDGRSIKVKLKHFLRYLRSNKDDSPLYIFDTSFDEDRLAKRILSEYRVPCYFRDDLFGFISEARRPPYRWFLVGPERSGTTVHIDPLATNAWNSLIQGVKRWVLFPPHVPKSVIKGKGLVRDDEDDEAIHYFMYILPRIKRKAMAVAQAIQNQYGDSSIVDSPYKDFCCYEFTQYPGETVFVPNGWWHAVLNVTDTVAVTQNFCSERNFEKVWLKTRTGRKRMAWKLLQQLDTRPEYKHLAEKARALNARDNFVMKYDPIEIAKREALKKQQEQNESDTESSKQEDSQRSGDDDSSSDDEDDNRRMEDQQKKKQRRRMSG